MREKSNIILTGILLGLLLAVGGVVGIFSGAYIGSMLEKSYEMAYKEIPAWATVVPAFICAFGFIAIVVGIIFPFFYIKEWSGSPIKDNGRIVEIIKRAKNGDMIVLAEFSNGQRRELIASKKLYLSAGDHGVIGAQGKHLVFFKRGQ